MLYSFLPRLFFTTINRQIYHRLILRNCHNILKQLEDQNVIYNLTKTREDVASFVRFNRQFESLNPLDYIDLYSIEKNPGKCLNELRTIELKIRLICAEYEHLCIINSRVPDKLSLQQMRSLLSCKSAQNREICLTSLYFQHSIKIRQKVKKIIKRKIRTTSRSDIITEDTLGCFNNSNELQYGLWKNCLFLRTVGMKTIRLQTAFNAKRYGPILAFDWNYPMDATNLKEKSINRLAYSINLIGNFNYKRLMSFTKPTFNIEHFNLDEESFFYKSLVKQVALLPFDLKFFQTTSKSYLDVHNTKKLFYFSPHYQQTFDLDEIDNVSLNDLVFIFSPFTELYGVKTTQLKESLLQRETQESSLGVQFRRLPLHNMIRNDRHVVISNLIQAFHNVLFFNLTWQESLYKNISHKYYLNTS